MVGLGSPSGFQHQPSQGVIRVTQWGRLPFVPFTTQLREYSRAIGGQSPLQGDCRWQCRNLQTKKKSAIPQGTLLLRHQQAARKGGCRTDVSLSAPQPPLNTERILAFDMWAPDVNVDHPVQQNVKLTGEFALPADDGALWNHPGFQPAEVRVLVTVQRRRKKECI